MASRLKYVILLGALIGSLSYAEKAPPLLLNVINEAVWGAVIGAAIAALTVFLAPIAIIFLTFLFCLILFVVLAPMGIAQKAYNILTRFLWDEK